MFLWSVDFEAHSALKSHAARLPESEAQPRRGWFKDQTMGSHREIPEKKYRQIYRTNPIDTWLEGRNVWNLCIFIIYFCYSQFTWNDETMTSMHHPDDREFKSGNSNAAVRTVESFVLCGELMLINIGNSTSTNESSNGKIDLRNSDVCHNPFCQAAAGEPFEVMVQEAIPREPTALPPNMTWRTSGSAVVTTMAATQSSIVKHSNDMQQWFKADSRRMNDEVWTFPPSRTRRLVLRWSPTKWGSTSLQHPKDACRCPSKARKTNIQRGAERTLAKYGNRMK